MNILEHPHTSLALTCHPSQGDARRLEALRERYRLNPRDDSDADLDAEPRVIRIVCSDGLTG